MSVGTVRPATGPAQRISGLTARLTRLELDAIVISGAADKRYYAGFTLKPGERDLFAGTLLVAGAVRRIIVDSRFTEQAARGADGWAVVEEIGSSAPILSRHLRELGARRVGLEATRVSHDTWTALAAELDGVELVPIDEELREGRVRKEPAEVAAISRACALGDACFSHLLEVVRPPMTERDVAWEIGSFFHAHGADVGFEPIVLVGERASMPHGQPGEAELRRGAGLLLDFGCRVDGYHSDMTRTIFVGRPDEEARAAYAAVADAQQLAIDALVDGVPGREIDALARAAVAERGQEPFRHAVGHGIGLEVHEPPSLRSTSDDRLGVAMVFSVEPGTYLPAQIGIRIEDIVHLGPDGPELLTRSPRDLVIVD